MTKRDDEVAELAAQNEVLRNMLRVALDGLAQTPPAAPVIHRRRKRGGLALPPVPGRKYNPEWQNMSKTCPQCEIEKLVVPGFGVRVVRGVERPQPWCLACRSTADYHSRPRKNKV